MWQVFDVTGGSVDIGSDQIHLFACEVNRYVTTQGYV